MEQLTGSGLKKLIILTSILVSLSLTLVFNLLSYGLPSRASTISSTTTVTPTYTTSPTASVTPSTTSPTSIDILCTCNCTNNNGTNLCPHPYNTGGRIAINCIAYDSVFPPVPFQGCEGLNGFVCGGFTDGGGVEIGNLGGCEPL